MLTEKIRKLLRFFLLDSSRHSLIAWYSKGIWQKVLIAAALWHDPEVLIFDEPRSGFDVTVAMIFRNLVRAPAAEGTMVLSARMCSTRWRRFTPR